MVWNLSLSKTGVLIFGGTIVQFYIPSRKLTNISHLGKRKIMFESDLGRVYGTVLRRGWLIRPRNFSHQNNEFMTHWVHEACRFLRSFCVVTPCKAGFGKGVEMVWKRNSEKQMMRTNNTFHNRTVTLMICTYLKERGKNLAIPYGLWPCMPCCCHMWICCSNKPKISQKRGIWQEPRLPHEAYAAAMLFQQRTRLPKILKGDLWSPSNRII